jgi:hypothetical protein
VFDAALLAVGAAVALDDKSGVVTIEVADVVANLMLPVELCIAELSVAKEFPEELFGRCLLLAKLPCSLDQTRKVVTAPILCLTPSPFGRGSG